MDERPFTLHESLARAYKVYRHGSSLSSNLTFKLKRLSPGLGLPAGSTASQEHFITAFCRLFGPWKAW